MKVDISKYPRAVNDVFDIFYWEQEEIRIVGGCVRDLVLGETPKDWDMCTPCVPELVMMILQNRGYKPFDLSNGHGTISVIIDGETIEITTLRIDAETDGRHAKVKFTTDWKQDAERRDFTFNAMSADAWGNVHDYFGGVNDLNEKIIKFVGNAEARIEEDYLRILRYFRFAQRFSLGMDTQDLLVIEANRHGLKNISGERIWMEMQKILVGNRANKLLHLMNEIDVLEAIGMSIR